MTVYRVEVARRALKILPRLLRREQQRIRTAIDLLVEGPRPPGAVRLVGEPDACQVWVGDYRIVYEVFDDRLVIQVVRLSKDVYRR